MIDSDAPQALAGLAMLTADTRNRVTAVIDKTIALSPYGGIADAPCSPSCPDYSLLDHVNDVVRTGELLGRMAGESWGLDVDWDSLVAILLLHDLDKLLMAGLSERATAVQSSDLELPHGVLGAFLLRDAGFSPLVVNTVAMHSVMSPVHGSSNEAFILHYADLFAADHSRRTSDIVPFYQIAQYARRDVDGSVAYRETGPSQPAAEGSRRVE